MYIILLPLFPVLNFWLQDHNPKVRLNLQTIVEAKQQGSKNVSNRLVIPAILLDRPFYQGKDISTLKQGPWLRPQGSTPDQKSNTVIADHRFTYNNPRGNFYFLDRLKPRDEIALFWQGKKYVYSVSSTKVVPATATDIEKPTEEARLTLYTCTPLWNPKDRLVVVAKLEQII